MAYVSPFEDAPVADKAQLKEASGANDNVLSRSLRGGIYGAGSQLLSAGAGVADAVSEGAGAGLHAKSQSLRDMAALPGNSPRVGSYEQLSNDFSMGNLAEYAGGLVGGSLPISAAGIAGGMLTGGAGFVPAMLGAGAATLPFNVGEVVQKQQADPQAMQQGAGQRLGDAFLGGAGASAVESLVPGLVGRQILGKGLGNLGKESVKQIVGRNALDIPLEGLTEGTGTAIKQYAANQDKALDWNEIKEGAIGGAAAGSVFTGVGTAADLAGSVAPAAGNALSSAGTALKTRFEGAKGAVGDAADAVAASPTGKKVKSVSDDLMDMVTKGKTKLDDTVGKMMRGEELGVDPAEWARATTDEAKARLTAMADSEGVKAATKWGKEMLDDVGLDEAKRQEVADAMANVAEKGGQVAMAGLRQTWEAGKKAAGLVNRFADSFNAHRTKNKRADVDVDASFVDDPIMGLGASPAAAGTAEDVTDVTPKPSMNARREFIAKAVESGMTPDDARAAYIESLNGPRRDVPEPPKYSMDDSGAREVVMSALESSGLSQKRPELFSSSESVNTMAGGLLSMVTNMTKGQLSAEQVSNAISVFGEATSSVMTSVRSALLADATPAETESFFKNLNEIDAIRKRSNGLHDTMRRAFTDEANLTEAPGRIEEDARLLIAHARGQFDGKSGAKPTAEQAYMNTLVNDFYTSNFGDKADVVRAAVEAEAAPAKADRVGAATTKEYDEDGQVIKADDTAGENSRDPLSSKFDEQGNRLESAETSTMKFGLSKPDTRGNSKSALNGAAMLETSRYAKQHMLDLKGQYPDHDVRFERLPDSEYGHVVVEARGDASAFNAQDFADMALDTKKFAKSPSRIDIGGHIIDAVKVAQIMRGKIQDKFEGDTPTNKKQRLIDGFKQGIAQLEIQFGQIDEAGNVTNVTNVSDDAIIGYVGGRALTWGQVQAEEKAGKKDTAENRMSAGGKAKLAALRAEYRTATPSDKILIQDEVLNLVEFEKDRELTAGGDTQERSMPRAKPVGPGLEGRPGSAVRTQSRGVDTQWSGDSRRAASARKQYDQRQDGKDVTPFEENDTRFDKDGMLTREGARMMLEGDFNGGINPVEMAARREGRADSEGAAPATGENRVRSYERGNQSQVRREVGLDENVHLVTNVNGDGANGAGPGRTANMDGSGHYVQSRAVEGLNTLTMVINDSWSQVKTAGAKAVTQRAKTLINNANLLSAADLRKLQSLAPDPVKGVRDVPAASVADAREVINELARKYQDVIVAPGEKAESVMVKPKKSEPTSKPEAPKNLMAENITKRQDYLNNPPVDYSAEKTKGIIDWATTQLERVDAEVAKLDKLVDDPGYDEARHDLVQTLQSELRALAKSAKAQVQNDKDMAGVDKKNGSDLFGDDAIGRELTRRGEARRAETSLIAQRVKKEGLPGTYVEAIGAIRPRSASALHAIEAALEAHELKTVYGIEPEDHKLSLGVFRKQLRGTEEEAQAWIDGTFSRRATAARSMQSRGSEGSPDPKSVAAKKAAFLSKVASGDKALLAELSSTDAKGLQRAADVLPAGAALDVVNTRLAELVQDEDVAYGLGTKAYSAESTDPTKNNATGKQPSKDIKAYIEKVLGKSVKLAWAKFSHAGEFQRMKTGDIIRLSVHALNPMSTAYHESLHAFIAQLKDAGAHDIVDVLYRAAGSQTVINQLNEIYKNQPAVLQQLKDPEERAAYMYQIWAANPKALTIGPATRNVFQKMADFIRSVLGIWSNDERALHIMRYFNDGSYAQSMGAPNATRRALMDPGRNKAVEVAKTFTQPLGKLAEALLSTGDARLRDTNIPALNQLADLIKRSGTDTGGDQGYIPASRIAATKQLSAMAETLSKYSPETLTAALNVVQSKGVPGTPEVTAAVQDIRAILRGTKHYMESAGVKMGDLGSEYFPRVWDTHYISQNEQAFRNMLEPYVRSGEFKGNPSDFIRSLTSRMGNEFGIETSTPGMQFTKKRDLDFLKAADVAPFLEKDLMGTLGSYITQATRRAEWERRLGGWDENLKETQLMTLMREAKEQGATSDNLKVAGEYLKGVDGTLGDNINPHARRIMGNMIVYQNVRLLPMAMFSMLIDPMGVLVRGGTIPEAFKTFKRGMASIPETYGRKTQADEATQLAELVGVVDAAVLSNVMSDVYTQGMVGGTARKINNAFFKYNMVEGLNRSFRVGASEAAMSFIARHADLKGTHSTRWLAELGLQPGDIKMLSSGTGVALAGSKTKNRIALTVAEGLTPAQETRIHAAINQWVDGAMLRPDAADKPIWMNDPHYALISHLKQFVFSFQKTILGRMMHEMRHGNYTPAMALASYVPMMIAADTAKGLIQGGGDTPEWKQGWGVTEYVGYGIQRAGLLGVGQFGLDVAEDVGRGGTGFGALSGPTLEQLADAVQLLGGNKQFGPMLLDAMPANALYKESLGGNSGGGPMHTE